MPNQTSLFSYKNYSEEAALHIVKTKMSMDEAVDFYSATKDVIVMRINVTGAKRRMAFKKGR